MKISSSDSSFCKTVSIMKKNYIIPALGIEEAQATQMIAESLIIDGNATVDGSEALTREDNGWEIWSDEE